jgi:hypothetical protein
MAKKRIRKPTITQQIMQPAIEKLQKYQHNLTRKQYLRDVKRYIKFCREHFDSRTFDDCKGHIQDYSDYLKKEGYTASTIHTYLSPVCSIFEVDLSKIEKPRRYVADYQKGRNIYISCQRMFKYLGVGEWMSPNAVAESGKLYMIKKRSKELNMSMIDYIYSDYIKEVEIQFGCNISKSVYVKKYAEYLV